MESDRKESRTWIVREKERKVDECRKEKKKLRNENKVQEDQEYKLKRGRTTIKKW